MPLVSVVVPTHNRAGRLTRAIQSALSQTERDLEVIIVDDGSTDDTANVIDRLTSQDRRVRSVPLSGGNGAATARNAGMAIASGDLLAFLDDDDEWLPSKVERQRGFLAAHPDVGLVSCNFTIVGSGRATAYRGPAHVTKKPLLWANVLMGCSFVMINRRSFSFDPGFDEEVVPAEDWDLWLRCSDERGIAIVPENLAVYTRHDVQLTGTTDRLQRGEAAFFAKNEDRMSGNERSFHRAHLLLQGSSDRSARMLARVEVLRRAPRAVAGVMIRLAIAQRLGRLRGDPGLPVRTLVRMVDRME